MEEYNKEKDHQIKEEIKKKLLETQDHKDLQWILDHFKDK